VGRKSEPVTVTAVVGEPAGIVEGEMAAIDGPETVNRIVADWTVANEVQPEFVAALIRKNIGTVRATVSEVPGMVTAKALVAASTANRVVSGSPSKKNVSEFWRQKWGTVVM